MATLNGHFKLPSKQEMLSELDEELRKKSGAPVRKYHLLEVDQGSYFEDLAKTAGIKRKPPVIHKLFLRARGNRNLSDCFRIIDDDTWEQVY